MVRCFPGALGFGQNNNTFYRNSAFFKHNFCLAPRWKINWPRWIFFFYISPLKSLNLVLIPGAKLDGYWGTCTGCMSSKDFKSWTQPFVSNFSSLKALNKYLFASINGNIWKYLKNFVSIDEKYCHLFKIQPGQGISLFWSSFCSLLFKTVLKSFLRQVGKIVPLVVWVILFIQLIYWTN